MRIILRLSWVINVAVSAACAADLQTSVEATKARPDGKLLVYLKEDNSAQAIDIGGSQLKDNTIVYLTPMFNSDMLNSFGQTNPDGMPKNHCYVFARRIAVDIGPSESRSVLEQPGNKCRWVPIKQPIRRSMNRVGFVEITFAKTSDEKIEPSDADLRFPPDDIFSGVPIVSESLRSVSFAKDQFELTVGFRWMQTYVPRKRRFPGNLSMAVTRQDNLAMYFQLNERTRPFVKACDEAAAIRWRFVPRGQDAPFNYAGDWSSGGWTPWGTSAASN